jgi:hypothetical protein
MSQAFLSTMPHAFVNNWRSIVRDAQGHPCASDEEIQLGHDIQGELDIIAWEIGRGHGVTPHCTVNDDCEYCACCSRCTGGTRSERQPF